jgi:hypothetical protein
MSSVEHLLGTHDVMELWILSRPVVHWQFVSVMEQPEAGTATAKHVNY